MIEWLLFNWEKSRAKYFWFPDGCLKNWVPKFKNECNNKFLGQQVVLCEYNQLVIRYWNELKLAKNQLP